MMQANLSSSPRETLLLLDNFDSFTFNLYQMLEEAIRALKLSLHVKVFRNNELSFEAIQAMAPRAIVLSPGPGHPAIHEDFRVCAEVLTRYSELPYTPQVLGVCLGHQGMAHYFGGKVITAPEMMHGKTSDITLLEPEDTLWEGLSNPLTVMRYHSLVADPATLPSCFKVTATFEGIIMGIRHEVYPLRGVQFHPESIGTPEGLTLLSNFVRLC
ncbi:MAG: anthranilate synthase component II [Vampirovibrionales bacterium]